MIVLTGGRLDLLSFGLRSFLVEKLVNQCGTTVISCCTVSCYGLGFLELSARVFTVWIVKELLLSGITSGGLRLEHFSEVFLGALAFLFSYLLSLGVAFVFDCFKLVHRLLLYASRLLSFLPVLFVPRLYWGWVWSRLLSLLISSRWSHRVLQWPSILAHLRFRRWRFALSCCLWLLSCYLTLTPFKVRFFFDCLFLLRIISRLIVAHSAFRRLVLFLLSGWSLDILRRLLLCQSGLDLSIRPYWCIFIENWRASWPTWHPARLLGLFKSLSIILILLLWAHLRRYVDWPFALQKFPFWLIIFISVRLLNHFSRWLPMKLQFFLK